MAREDPARASWQAFFALFAIIMGGLYQSPSAYTAEGSPDLKAWGIETLDRIEKDLRRPGSALYADYGTINGKRGAEFGGYAFIWPSSYMLSALAAAARIQPDRYRERVIVYADALDAYWIEKEGIGGYAVLPHGSERYHDDNALMALALIDAYEVTRERRFLVRAIEALKFVASGESKTRGGGIRQHEDRSGAAAVCATAPATLCALRVYNHTRDRSYLRQAERWHGFLLSESAGLRDARTGLFHEQKEGSLAYLSAWVLQSSLLFYKQTGKKEHLEEGQRIANSAIVAWVLPGGALRESGKWGGSDLCDALIALYQTDGNARWYTTAVGILRFLHEHGADAKGRYGEYWNEVHTGQLLPKFFLLSMATVARAYWAAAAVRPPVITTILPTSQSTGQLWRYVTQAPPMNWHEREFDDSGWTSGAAGFGTPETPGTVVRTRWATKEIWLRRTFVLPEGTPLERLHLLVHHDDDAEIYLNGRLVARLKGYTTGYTLYPVRAAGLVVPGTNTLAIHVRQDFGGQYIDAGIVSVGQGPPR
jgi:hypothetical protein